MSLLPDSENSNSLTSRVLKYVTSVGRMIIIFTELIVITAFLSRFWLDRKNSDLSEVIRQQKAILESTRDFETEYSLLQQRLKFIKDNNTKTASLGPSLINLAESAPPEIVFDSIAVAEYSLPLKARINVNTYNEDSIVTFATNLLLNPNIQSVDIGSIEKKPKDGKYTISLNIIFKPQAKND